jgi:hypothetical protein
MINNTHIFLREKYGAMYSGGIFAIFKKVKLYDSSNEFLRILTK